MMAQLWFAHLGEPDASQAKRLLPPEGSPVCPLQPAQDPGCGEAVDQPAWTLTASWQEV